MENSLAKLANMAAAKGKVSFLAIWWAKGAFCLFDHCLWSFLVCFRLETSMATLDWIFCKSAPMARILAPFW